MVVVVVVRTLCVCRVCRSDHVSMLCRMAKGGEFCVLSRRPLPVGDDDRVSWTRYTSLIDAVFKGPDATAGASASAGAGAGAGAGTSIGAGAGASSARSTVRGAATLLGRVVVDVPTLQRLHSDSFAAAKALFLQESVAVRWMNPFRVFD